MILINLAALLAVRPEGGDVLGPAGMLVGMGLAGVIMWSRSAELPDKERKAWRLMVIGLLLAAAGVLVTGVFVAAGVEVPAFGLIDAFFIGTYVALFLAICLLARADAHGRDWVITLLDAFVGGLALAGLLWTAFQDRLLENISTADAPGWQLGVALIYPIIDAVALVALMILVMRRSHFRWDIRLLFLALTLLFQFAADLTFLDRGLGTSFQNAEPVYPLFLLTSASALLGAALVDRVPTMREYPERAARMLALMWPYVLVFILVITHVVRFHELTGGRAVALDALVLIGVVALVRQLIVINHHRSQIELHRSELVASVSHELRTPLTAIVGYLAILEEDDDFMSEETKREMLGDASDQARHMARLVSDLMLLAKGFDGQVPLEINETTVSDLVRDATAVLPDASIEVETEDDSIVKVDGDRIRQAVVNMLTNAHRYGGGRILVRSRVRHERTLVLEVHDDGGGVPTRYENLIWERFERGANRLDSSTPGMGIGLAILRAVAQSHGGSAGYRRSEVLGGACFSLTIPGCVVARRVELRAEALRR